MPEEIVGERCLNGPFRVGDRVRRIGESCGGIGVAIPVGAIGIVVGPRLDTITTVRFDGYPTGRADNTYGSYTNRLELVVDLPAAPVADDGEIRVGDRVRRIRRPSLRRIPVGALGTVVRVPDPGSISYCINWDGHADDGRHTAPRYCIERVAPGMVPTAVITAAPAASPTITPGEVVERAPGEFRLGDRVRVVRSPVDGGLNWPPVGSEGVVVAANDGQSRDDRNDMRVDFSGVPGAAERSWASSNWYCRSARLEHDRDIVEAVSPAPKLFRIVRHTDHGSPEDVPGESFDDGREAGARAAQLTLETGVKHQPRRNAISADWREREKSRFADGIYQPIPEGWDLAPIPDHFLHLSKLRGYVAYTPGESYGQADRQIVKRAGCYVAEFYPHLSKHDQGRYAALVSCEGQLRLGMTREDFRRAYVEGPDSCMSDPFSSLPCHPSEVYAAGDLAIAWLDDDGRITGRCVVWPEKKLRTRCYGDVEKMRSVLRAAGYEAGNFEGARLLKVKDEDEGRIVCPYIDECDSVMGSPQAIAVIVLDDHLVLTENIDDGIQANQTDGWLDYEDDTPARARCARCSVRTDEDDLSLVRPRYGISQSWCLDCRDNRAFYCDGLNDHVADDVDAYYGGGTLYPPYSTYSQLYVETRPAFVSDYDNTVFPTFERVELEDGSEWAASEFAEHGFTCAGSGHRYSRDEPHETIDGLAYHADHLPAQRPEAYDPSPEGLPAA